jgi:hypothetical protein
MPRFLWLVVLAGLLTSFGCGQGEKVIPPKEVPAAPKGPPAGDPGKRPSDGAAFGT